MDGNIKQNLKGYELRDRLGAGGFGAVYRAYQSTVGREVAIKIILPGLANQPEFIRRFEGEAQLVARLEHPHITPLYDYWRDPDGAYLVMRWLRGGSLRDALQNGAYALPAACTLLEQVAGALSLAHRSGVIHRDIKPGNILLDEDGNAYLTDFGIAKDLNLQSSNTQQDAIVGSLDYISPEQARSEPVTPRTDIYSLGVTLYEMITGEHPFGNISSVERLFKHINDPLPEITILDARVSEAVNQVIQKATAKNPEGRYPDALAFAADFREAIGLNRASTTAVELLTQREHEILNLIIDGLSNKEIAQKLTVTLSTVKWYVNQIYSKLGVRSRVQAIVRAREMNLIVKAGQEMPLISIVPTEDFHPENPYKGLRAFQSGDNQDFFGREKVTAKLVKRLGEGGESGRFLAVVGPSGSGKSSLVKAGLIPALWRGELPGSEKWFVVEMLPGSYPLDELEIALTKIAANQAGNLREQLVRDNRGLVRTAQLVLPNDESELVVVIDQFEEVFTLVEDEEARTHFLDLLVAAVQEPRSRVRVVITLRADFYDRPLHYPAFGELVRTRLETIMPLSAEELERAITRPAERVGVRFEPGLVAGIIGDVNYQPGALPLLQYALTELFEQHKGRMLTREGYQAIGGTVGALARRAEELYLSLNSESQQMARQLFLRLVTLGEGTEDTRRRAQRSELLAIAEDGEVMEEIIDLYAEYRLFALDTDPGTRSPTVEVAHEALLREWERLRAWLNESREDIRQERLLYTAAADWEANGRDTSYLLNGTRLEQAESWTASTGMSLTGRERAFVQASVEARERQAAEAREQQIRETRLEQRSQTFLRGLVAVLLVATVGAIMLSAFALDREQQAQSARATSEANLVRAEREAAVSHSLLLANKAEDLFVGGQTELALLLALESVSITEPPIESEQALRSVAFGAGSRAVFRGHTNVVEAITYSPDDQYALSAACGQLENSACIQGEMILWDLQTETELHRFTGHEGFITSVLFTEDGQNIWSASTDGQLILWDANPSSALYGNILGQYALEHGAIHAITFWENSLVAGTDEGVVIFDTASNSVIRVLSETSSSTVNAVSISGDGLMAAAGMENTQIVLWELITGEVVQRLEGHNKAVTQVLFHPSLPRLLSSGVDATLFMWDLGSGTVLGQYHTPTYINDFILSPDGTTAIVDGGGGAIPMVALDTMQMSTYLLNNPDGQVTQNAQTLHAAAYSRLATSFLTGHEDGSIVLWNLPVQRDTQHFQTDSVGSGFAAMDVSLDGRRMLSGTFEGGEALLWDIDAESPTYGSVITQLGSAQGMGVPVRLSPDGRIALVGTGDWFGDTGDRSLSLWNVDEESSQFGQLIRELEGYSLLPRSMAFTPDGRYILVGTSLLEAPTGELLMWETATGNLVHRFDTDVSVASILVSPDGKRAWAAHNSLNLMVEWDIDPESPTFGAALQQVETLGFVFDLDWSPDGDSLLVAEAGSELVERDYATGAIRRTLNGLGLAIWSVEVRDAYVIGGNERGEVALWDYESGSLLWISAPQESFVSHLNFSPDGHYAYSLAISGNPVQWQIGEPTHEEMLEWIVANRYLRDATCEERELYQITPLCVEGNA